ncbi:hypothetical protein CMQ_7728 [Grosmannia clavigera kw1407]|uniref:Uncharacterized protein n=1 Tax=Grosmannia clavigera (strain kw1407 / UAMH 11150) TaxID=655863 RepID=F0XPP1_GROCL|nr:uncharacterized protein CMQ_7728 [Grosmannia clavigera kw1407]EFX00726.1 hypothetical protein CMQ_7728 [Grosmannia clavigera kw1407]
MTIVTVVRWSHLRQIDDTERGLTATRIAYVHLHRRAARRGPYFCESPGNALGSRTQEDWGWWTIQQEECKEGSMFTVYAHCTPHLNGLYLKWNQVVRSA